MGNWNLNNTKIWTVQYCIRSVLCKTCILRALACYLQKSVRSEYMELYQARGSLSSIDVSILPRLTWCFNAILINIGIDFFVEIKNLDLGFIWKCKGPTVAQRHWNWTESEVSFCLIKTCYKSTVGETMEHYQKNQNNRPRAREGAWKSFEFGCPQDSEGWDFKGILPLSFDKGVQAIQPWGCMICLRDEWPSWPFAVSQTQLSPETVEINFRVVTSLGEKWWENVAGSIKWNIGVFAE